MNRTTITIRLRVETDAEPRALERAIELLIANESLEDTMLEGETVELLETDIDVGTMEPAPVDDADSERTRRADHDLDAEKDRRERGER
jgi:hypothetical protein